MKLLSRCRPVLSGLVVAFLSACDRPTVPQARDQIETTQRHVLAGTLSLGNINLERLLYASLGPYRWFAAEPLTVERDGVTTRYLAHVVERVYLPPPGTGALPYVKRTLFAWDKENQRGFAFAADDSVADIVSPTPELTDDNATSERVWHHPAFAVSSERNGDEAWFGAEGRIDFGVATTAGACSLEQRDIDQRFPPGWGHETHLTPTCEDAHFIVSGSTLLEKRRIAERPDFLDRAFASKVSLRFDAQSVHGTRITTQCAEEFDIRQPPPFECGNSFLFWRDQRPFAPGLGLDVMQIDHRDQPSPYIQVLTPGVRGTGSPASTAFVCCTSYGGPAHYAVRTPDGKTLREVDVENASYDSLLGHMVWPGTRVFRDNMRALVLINGRTFQHARTRWVPLIVDLTILPCPAGKRRVTTGQGFPTTGDCHPT